MIYKDKRDLHAVLLQQMDIAAFECEEGNIFRLINPAPDWINAFIQPTLLSEKIDISQYFPYLEIFIPQLQETDAVKNVRIYSDIWTEKNEAGEEKYLQAIGLNLKEDLYLLIISHEGSLYKHKELLQIGRENKLATEKIKRAKEELERLLKFKNQFVSIVSHDLRSPVSSVVSITNMMLADEEFKENVGEIYLDFVENVNKDMKLLLEYNEKLYYWSNLQLGKFNLDLKMLNLKEMISLIRSRLEKKTSEKNISLVIKIDDNFSFRADESLIMQALTNLVVNAIKFTPPNGRIEIRSKMDANNKFVEISDNGVGIKAEVLSKLFSGYVKEHKSGTNGEMGTGLGLGIVKRILDAHDFRIEVDSEVNKGTTFSIIIPAKTA
ncbi:MAG: HAMP domain-containing histidine kinase [Bacteroidales bacterium]|nr:HAMP domain-containing histidine kinase [Bacteroidales bacterium]MCF8387475.1 HAMP domain-containing histidine kinase [Bacteroidales bacterium]MCF8398905.1 HAMP domain-containing histidine kinase [Bacteroidales bacterium]